MTRRGQASLLSVALAVVVLVSVTALGVAAADGALRAADRQPLERHAARAVADRLVTADAVTHRDGVLRAAALDGLTAADLAALAPPAAGRTVRVRVGNRTPVSPPGARGGTTVRRAVRVGRVEPGMRRADLGTTRRLVVPAGVGRTSLYVNSGPNATVETVLADGRPVLHADAGVEGTATLHLSRYDATTLRLVVEGNATGRARARYRRLVTRPAVLEVTVRG